MKRTLIAWMIILLILVDGIHSLFPQEMSDLSQLMFSSQAKAAQMERDGTLTGYKLLGHTFSYPGYFHGTSVATGAEGYNGCSLPVSDDGIEGPNFLAQTCGLNPVINLNDAYAQIERVAKARGLKPSQVREFVDAQVDNGSRTMFSEAIVNVRELNIALDDMKRKYISRPSNHNGRNGVRSRICVDASGL